MSEGSELEGVGSGVRTRHIQSTSLMLYQMSYSRLRVGSLQQDMRKTGAVMICRNTRGGHAHDVLEELARVRDRWQCSPRGLPRVPPYGTPVDERSRSSQPMESNHLVDGYEP